MAYYEFQCTKCQKHFTVKQTFAEHDRDPKPKCPQCGSEKVQQLPWATSWGVTFSTFSAC